MEGSAFLIFIILRDYVLQLSVYAGTRQYCKRNGWYSGVTRNYFYRNKNIVTIIGLPKFN